MTRDQEKIGRSIARAIRAIEFDATLIEERLEADVVETGRGHVPRIEVRHPVAEHHGVLWLVAIIAIEPEPAITYAVRAYRRTIELALRSVLSARAA